MRWGKEFGDEEEPHSPIAVVLRPESSVDQIVCLERDAEDKVAETHDENP